MRLLLAFPFEIQRMRFECNPAIRTAALFCLLWLSSCQSVSPVRQSHDQWDQGHLEEAVTTLREASARDPGNKSLKAAYQGLRERALAQLTIAAEHMRDAGQYEQARDLLRTALRLDPDYPGARDGIAEIDAVERQATLLEAAQKRIEAGDLSGGETQLRAILAQNPTHPAARRLLQQLREKQVAREEAPASLKAMLNVPVTLDLRDTPIRNVFDALSHTAGLNFVFDRDVHADAKVTIFIRNSSIEDVLRLVLTTNGLARKVLNDNTVLVYPNNAAKAREYEDLVVRTFYLVNADTKQVQALLKSMTHTKEIYADEKLNMITIRDTADAVRLAERLVETVDVADAEVMLEVEVMEVSRSRAQQLGLQFPGQVSRGIGAAAATPPATLTTSQLGHTVTSLPNPLLVANLFLQDQDSNLLANPRIRVKNHEKAKVLIGEKLPIITSTAVANTGVSTSVSYVDVGLKLEVEPQIYLDDEVGIKVNLEVTSNLGAVTQAGVTAYDVGTRTATTALRLHDGETQVLAGLINDSDQATVTRVPGLGDLPVVGHLFSNDNSNRDKSEIVLLITPRIIRNVVTPDYDALLLPAGTEADIGAHTLSIGRTPPHSLAISAQPGATAAVTESNRAPLVGAAPAGQTPGNAPRSAFSASLQAPPAVKIGEVFEAKVQIPGSEGALSGSLTLGYEADVLEGEGSSGRLIVPLLPSSTRGPLQGTASLGATANSAVQTTLRIIDGSVAMPDGTQVPIAAGSVPLSIQR
ncbi:MAG: secretin and TonB N-terminal domain-containing protein [Burkholderiaceae bacterium]|nr:secretin and TonB N-terminal domain-containing protein [Burkholderiaceae bacterium]